MRQTLHRSKRWGLDSDIHEGRMTKAVEHQTAKLPSISFLSVALGAIGLSLLLKTQHKDETANFVGLWVPTILLLGLYNKIVKTQGSD